MYILQYQKKSKNISVLCRQLYAESPVSKVSGITRNRAVRIICAFILSLFCFAFLIVMWDLKKRLHVLAVGDNLQLRWFLSEF